MYFANICVLLVVLVGYLDAQRLTNIVVEKDVKNDILFKSKNKTDAYDKFIDAYTDLEDSLPTVTQSTDSDPVKLRQTREKRENTLISTIRKCKAHNKKFRNGGSTFKMTVNSFSIMDAETRKRFLGLNNNAAVLLENSRYRSPPRRRSVSSLSDLPVSFDWKERGMVTGVKNQGSCGSSWTHAAVGPIEYAYKNATGTLLSFSEQELLDCTYENSFEVSDGCNGGWYTNAWDFVIESNHLSSEFNYTYGGTDGSCSHSSHGNGLVKKVNITGYTQSAAGSEEAVLTDLVREMPLAVAFTVQDDFYSFGRGVYDGCSKSTTTASPNHAAIMTGYAEGYFEIKNSWGSDWGMSGYGRLQRGRNICGILSHAYYVEFKDLDSSDLKEEKDESSDVSVDDDSGGCSAGYYMTRRGCVMCQAGYWSAAGATECEACPSGKESSTGSTSPADCKTGVTCEDENRYCVSWADLGYCDSEYMKLNCKMSCQLCDGGNTPQKSQGRSSWRTEMEPEEETGTILFDREDCDPAHIGEPDPGTDMRILSCKTPKTFLTFVQYKDGDIKPAARCCKCKK